MRKASASADIVIVEVEAGAPRLAWVQPVPAHIVLSPGETTALSSIAFDQHGTELKGVTFSWQLLESRAGTITPSGVFRAGFTEGNFNDALVVTARAPTDMGPGLVQTTASITVEEFRGQLRPASIRVFPESAEVELGENLLLVALAVDANGIGIPDMNFQWEMLGSVAGFISQDGRLTAGESIGKFPNAIKVTATPKKADESEIISTTIDVQVMDPISAIQQISATVIPQVISLRPEQRVKFTTMVLDRRGNPISPVDPRWEILDPKAGIISQDGQFRAGVEPGVYSDAVQVSMEVPGLEQRVVPVGTVIIQDVTSPASPQPQQLLPTVTIYPNRVVLSPGEQARVSIIGLNADVQALSTTNIRWSLDPPQVGEVSQYITVTAHDVPGIYEAAIRAEVTLQTESGPLTREVSATLVIRGPLENVEITPQVDTLARGEKTQFRAIAYDRNRVLLSDVYFRWKVMDPTAGTIDANGVFTAEGSPGEYPGAVQVLAIQRPGISAP